MHKMISRHAALMVSVVFATAIQTSSLSAETKAGVATTVENKVLGILRGNAEVLTTGSDVFMDQTVRTEDASTTQLLLLDQTNISVGTRSEVVLDRFVFDPNRPQGDVVLNATKGVFRFVTGSQDHNSYHIKTPSATIGVRGTVVEFNIIPVDPNAKPDSNLKTLEVLLKSGGIDVTLSTGQKIPMDDPDKILTIYQGGGYGVGNYVGSLYAATVGNVTGAFGQAAGGSGGGGTLPFVKPAASNASTGGNGGTGGTSGNGGTGQPTFLTTAPATARANTVTNTVSP